MEHTFVIDEYTVRRGEPQMILLFCMSCGAYIMDYQKDGPGPLLRCYFDRIHAPQDLADSERLTCNSCAAFIGAQVTYIREKRLAFALDEGKVMVQLPCGSQFPSQALK